MLPDKCSCLLRNPPALGQSRISLWPVLLLSPSMTSGHITPSAGEAPRKTALLQLCFRTQVVRSSGGDGAASSSGFCGRNQQPASMAASRHTCLLLHIAHTGITPALAELLSSCQVLVMHLPIISFVMPVPPLNALICHPAVLASLHGRVYPG